MSSSDRPDKLVIKTQELGKAVDLTAGDSKMVSVDPEGVTITRGLADRFPRPVSREAGDLIDQIFAAHRESDGILVIELADRFRKSFGWHARVEWFRVLGLEVLNEPELVQEQQAYLSSLYQCLDGTPPANATPIERDLDPGTLRWAIGANHLNLMEWLWKAGLYAQAIEQFEPSLQGLTPNSDTERRIERYLYRASCEHRLGLLDKARSSLTAASELGSEEFAKVWSLHKAKMTELNAIVESL